MDLFLVQFINVFLHLVQSLEVESAVGGNGRMGWLQEICNVGAESRGAFVAVAARSGGVETWC